MLGSFVVDTIFIKDYKKFDVIVGCIMIKSSSFKSLFKFDAINRLWFKIFKTFPDHGTASDIIFKNKADLYSLKNVLIL